MSSLSKPTTICAGQNRISELPEDVLCHIVSLLPLKEAGRTSVISKSWKHVWAYIYTLDFDSSKLIDNEDILFNSHLLEVEASKYLCWVDQVIRSYKAPMIDQFRVQFDFSKVNRADNFTDIIHNWLRFAMEKRVKRLEIDFTEFFGSNNTPCFTFPKSLSCNSLTSLELTCVDVTGDILEGFISNCLALEYLSVNNSSSLVELTVAGPLLKLKKLNIYCCFSLDKLEISAPNLVSVCYIGKEANVQFKNTPKIAHVSLGSTYAKDLMHCFSNLSSYFSQIEELTLNPKWPLDGIILPTEDLVFSRLKKLNVTLDVYEDDDLFLFGALMKACPFVHHFKLELNVENSYYGKKVGSRKPRKPSPFLHNHLKIVEIVGFRGKQIDLGIAFFLIETAVALERITIDPTDIYVPEFNSGIMKRRMRAEVIRACIKPGTKFEII